MIRGGRTRLRLRLRLRLTKGILPRLTGVRDGPMDHLCHEWRYIFYIREKKIGKGKTSNVLFLALAHLDQHALEQHTLDEGVTETSPRERPPTPVPPETAKQKQKISQRNIQKCAQGKRAFYMRFEYHAGHAARRTGVGKTRTGRLCQHTEECRT